MYGCIGRMNGGGRDGEVISSDLLYFIYRTRFTGDLVI
jgi:hypothetical protein